MEGSLNRCQGDTQRFPHNERNSMGAIGGGLETSFVSLKVFIMADDTIRLI